MILDTENEMIIKLQSLKIKLKLGIILKITILGKSAYPRCFCLKIRLVNQNKRYERHLCWAV